MLRIVPLFGGARNSRQVSPLSSDLATKESARLLSTLKKSADAADTTVSPCEPIREVLGPPERPKLEGCQLLPRSVRATVALQLPLERERGSLARASCSRAEIAKGDRIAKTNITSHLTAWRCQELH